MFLTYKPEDGDAQQWVINLNKIRSGEAEQIEKVTGWDFSEFSQHLLKNSVLARRALLWTYQKRAHAKLRFADVDFALDELELEFDKDELTAGLVELRDLPPTTDRDQSIRFVEQLLETAPDAPGKAQES